MTLDYFYGQSGELFSYFRIPKALFQDHRFRQLSTDARTLYGILLDRMSLSAKNGWLDEQGRVYIIYTVREVQEYEELIRRLYEAISFLPPMQARRVHARYMLGMKVKDIAAMEGITPSQAGKSIHAALRRLRRYFARQKWMVNL